MGRFGPLHLCVCRILNLQIYLALSFALIYFFLCVCILDFRMVPSHAHFHLGLHIIGWHILARFFDTLFNYSSYELWQYIILYPYPSLTLVFVSLTSPGSRSPAAYPLHTPLWFCM